MNIFFNKNDKRINFNFNNKIELDFYYKFGFNIKYLYEGFNDFGYPLFILHILFGAFYLTLPWKHKEKYKKNIYGIGYQNFFFIFNFKNKVKIINLPFGYYIYRTSTINKNNEWNHHIHNKNSVHCDDFYYGRRILFKFKKIKNKETPKDIWVTYYIIEKEWRQKWLKWTKYFSKKERYLDVVYDDGIYDKNGKIYNDVFTINNNDTIKGILLKMGEKYNLYSPYLIRNDKIKKILSNKI